MWLLRLRQTAVKSLGQLTAPDATGPITDLITPSHGNGDPVRERTTDYKLDIWFCQTSLEALERILNASPSSINETDLERIATQIVKSFIHRTRLSAKITHSGSGQHGDKD